MDWFAAQILTWFDAEGRHDLPWQDNPTPYRVWVSEVMLQQTQVATVIPYYHRFMARFPDVTDLASASQDEVLHLWTGLGYYARARNLHAAAKRVCELGDFPDSVEGLEELPGIGRSTAGAIAAIAMGHRGVILDGNVRRVLARFHAIAGHYSNTEVLDSFWAHANQHTPHERTNHYTQAIMDLGSMVCTRRNPGCGDCPVVERCAAYATRSVDRYPAPKPRKEKPVRAVRMFVVSTADGAHLLERRPDKGIWGGLWTPPERASDVTPDAFCLEFGIHFDSILSSHAAPMFRHTFTHYHLDIEPFFLTLDQLPDTAADADGSTWYRPGQNEPLGLSAPAVKLLAAAQEFELAESRR